MRAQYEYPANLNYKYFRELNLTFIYNSLAAAPKFKSGIIVVRLNGLSLSVPVSWYLDMPGKQADGSHVFDLLDPADKNWNVWIDNPSSTPWLTLSPSAASSGDLENGKIVTELSSKYASHVYLHVAQGPYGIGTIQKSSAGGGEPKVTRIIITRSTP